MKRTFLLISLSFLTLSLPTFSSPSSSQTNHKTKTSANKLTPLVKQISENIYQIGKITFNKKNRSIHFPASANLTEAGSLIEYLIIHKNGEKLHEALIITDINPSNLNIAFKLLHYKESKELFRIYRKDGVPGDTYHRVEDSIRKASRFTIDITYKKNKKEITSPITQWLSNTQTGKPMPPTPWVYSGSYFFKKIFAAKRSGSICSVLPDENALAGYSGDDRDDDTLWVANKNLPSTGSPVTISFKPWSGTLKPQSLKIKPYNPNH